jgi:hypothetical protein
LTRCKTFKKYLLTIAFLFTVGTAMAQTCTVKTTGASTALNGKYACSSNATFQYGTLSVVIYTGGDPALTPPGPSLTIQLSMPAPSAQPGKCTPTGSGTGCQAAVEIMQRSPSGVPGIAWSTRLPPPSGKLVGTVSFEVTSPGTLQPSAPMLQRFINAHGTVSGVLLPYGDASGVKGNVTVDVTF